MTAATPQRVILVGLSGAGKSAAGQRAAQLLRERVPEVPWAFVDTDREIERRAGRTVAEIFARQGEAAFRKLEAAVSADLIGRGPLIVATGGGWIQLTEPVRAMRQGSVMLYLQVSPEVAASRLEDNPEQRPLLAGADRVVKLAELLARRESLYLQAEHTLSVDSLSVDEVASYIVALATGGSRD